MMSFKKNRGPRSKLPHWTKIIYSYVTIMCTMRKLPVNDHMTYVVKIDILTGHVAKGNLHFILKIIFSLHICQKTCIFSKLVHLIMKVLHICQKKFC